MRGEVQREPSASTAERHRTRKKKKQRFALRVRRGISFVGGGAARRWAGTLQQPQAGAASRPSPAHLPPLNSGGARGMGVCPDSGAPPATAMDCIQAAMGCACCWAESCMRRW